MKTKKLILTTLAGAALPFASFAQSGEFSETVEQSGLPQPVQKTIQQHASGGEVVRVLREDDSDGRWNYEVVVKSNGKEWGFEVSPKGKFVRKRNDVPK
jgi:hypothetical protein